MEAEDLQAKASALPHLPGIYLMKNKKNKVIYVGAASSLKNRVSSYFSGKHEGKIAHLVERITDFEVEVTQTENGAFLRERDLIEKHRPAFNVKWLDQKSYPLLCVTTSDSFPRLLLVRDAFDDGNRYFPRKRYAWALRRTIRTIRRIFPIRTCSDKIEPNQATRKRPCLDHQLGLCDAPCVLDITEKKYRSVVNSLILFLEGKKEALIDPMYQEMEISSANLDFEKAAKLRDRIKAIEETISRQEGVSVPRERDYIGFHRNAEGISIITLFIDHEGNEVGTDGEIIEGKINTEDTSILSAYVRNQYLKSANSPKEIVIPFPLEQEELVKTWLSKKTQPMILRETESTDQEYLARAAKRAKLVLHESQSEMATRTVQDQTLQELVKDLEPYFSIPVSAEHIEGIDISSLSGGGAVGSLVTFKQGKPSKNDYRRFNIKRRTTDDISWMQEVFERRYRRILQEGMNLPHLILLDGGKGHLNAICKVAKNIGLTDVPIVALAKKEEKVYVPGRRNSISISLTSLKVLQQVRDEAHRFAISFQRSKRRSVLDKSELDNIQGVGEVRKRALIQAFGSVQGVKQATLEELCDIPGIGPKKAEAIFLHFNHRKYKK